MVKFQGVVEVFYGPLWDWIDRINLLEFMGRIEFNIYIYGPKWDPYHRLWWRSPYNLEFTNEFTKFIDAGKRYGVEVCFALSPGLDIDYSSSTDLRLLLRKYSLFMDLGIEVIALFLDDIPPVLRGKGFKSLAEAQAKLVNTIYRELKPRAMVFCPTHYRGVKVDYLSVLDRLLDPEVYVMWTGMYVCPITVSSEDLEKVSRALGRRPFIWENYPVNDYFTCRGITRLHLGPIEGRTLDMNNLVSGYTANPANQVEASKIPLYTIAEMLKQGSRYDPDRALKEAIALVINKSARFWFEKFIEYNKATFMNLNEKTITRENADEVLEVIKYLEETLWNKRLMNEIKPILEKMKSIARYAKGEEAKLNFRIQTAGEYNPPMTNDHMREEMFGDVVRSLPWYTRAYPKPQWW